VWSLDPNFNSNVADRSLKPATDYRSGKPLPYQLGRNHVTRQLSARRQFNFYYLYYTLRRCNQTLKYSIILFCFFNSESPRRIITALFTCTPLKFLLKFSFDLQCVSIILVFTDSQDQAHSFTQKECKFFLKYNQKSTYYN
jgi:hypothetical protein